MSELYLAPDGPAALLSHHTLVQIPLCSTEASDRIGWTCSFFRSPVRQLLPPKLSKYLPGSGFEELA